MTTTTESPEFDLLNETFLSTEGTVLTRWSAELGVVKEVKEVAVLVKENEEQKREIATLKRHRDDAYEAIASLKRHRDDAYEAMKRGHEQVRTCDLGAPFAQWERRKNQDCHDVWAGAGSEVALLRAELNERLSAARVRARARRAAPRLV